MTSLTNVLYTQILNHRSGSLVLLDLTIKRIDWRRCLPCLSIPEAWLIGRTVIIQVPQHCLIPFCVGPPLVVLAGDVGSGKTELAETIGDAVARQENIDITLMPLSLSTRGQGRVGEMTQLISTAFAYTLQEAEKLANRGGRSRGAVILLVDEADALAQSREASQMHHEDRAGVNAFIRGVDQIANAKVPAAIIMCTNRLNSLDPAVRRRAADILEFSRPNDAQRQFVLSARLEPLGLTPQHLQDLVSATGPAEGRSYGFTFSDLTQRLIPALVLDAYPSKPVDGTRAVQIALGMTPTPPFQDTPAGV